MFPPIVWYPRKTTTATADKINAYSVMVWPRLHSRVETYLLTNQFTNLTPLISRTIEIGRGSFLSVFSKDEPDE
jgi:hypothetical protein